MNRSYRIALVWVLAASACLASGCKDTVDALTAAASEPAADAPIVPGQVTGRWGTRWGTEVCNLVLQQNGDAVTGTYTSTGAPPGTVSGTLSNGVLTGTWQDQSGGAGGIALTFAPDGHGFQGTWGTGASATNGGSWTGSR